MSQWVYLGYQINVCMSRPDNCAAAGGAVSFWMKVTDCSGYHGIVSSQHSTGAGFVIFCVGNSLGYYAFT